MEPQAQGTRRRISIERSYAAAIEDVWELWTTKDGIESWWGPDGFSVSVGSIDLRPGGEMDYAMSAVSRDQIEFRKKAGMPVTTDHHVTFTEVEPRRRLPYTQPTDFIPGIKPYEVTTMVEFEEGPDGVRIVLTFDAMHDDHWTEMAAMGWTSELDRLGKALEARR